MVALERQVVRVDALTARALRMAKDRKLDRVAHLEAGQGEREGLVVRVVDVALERARVDRLGEVGRQVNVAT